MDNGNPCLSANPSPLTLVRCAVLPLGVCTTLLSCEHLLCVRCHAFGSLTTIMIANMCHVPLIDPSPQVLSVLLPSWLGWYLPIRVWERWPHLPSFHSVYFEVPTATCQSTNCSLLYDLMAFEWLPARAQFLSVWPGSLGPQ